MRFIGHLLRYLVAGSMIAMPMTAQCDRGAVWATAVSEKKSTGQAVVFRYIIRFEPNFRRSAYPHRVIVVWRYQSPSGMPSRTELEAMERLENALDPVIGARALGTLVLVSTGDNLREWTYYTKSEEAFLTALNEALAAQPRFPIEIHEAPDPEWSTYERFRKVVRGQEKQG
jgi:Family of unknown function (DUF695)